MNFRDELITTLEALDPQVDQTKAKLELDSSAVTIASLLAEPGGLALVEYIIDELECGKRPIYSTGKFVDRSQVERLIEHLYAFQEHKALSVLLPFYHQIWIRGQGKDTHPEETFKALRTLEDSDAADTGQIALMVCLDCCSRIDETSDTHVCGNCGTSNLFVVREFVLVQSARTVLKRGGYLEIYVKECMRKSEIDLVGWAFDESGQKAYTSIRYQVEGEKVDIDVHGIARPITLLLCEVKTTRKLPMNELRRVENLFTRLVRRVNSLAKRRFGHLKLFVITGEFDQNIPIGAYRRKNWELLDRTSIPNLVDKFVRIKSEL